MGSPVAEYHNPFEEFAIVVEHYEGMTPVQQRSRHSSMDGSMPPSPSPGKLGGKKRVGFTGDSTPRSASLTPGGSGINTPAERQNSDTPTTPGPSSSIRDHRSHLPHLSAQDTEQIKQAFAARIARPRPALRNPVLSAQRTVVDSEDDSDGLDNEKAYRRRKAREALERGKALEEENVRTLSEPVSPSTSSEQGYGVERRPSDLDLNQGPLASPRHYSSVAPALPSPDITNTDETLLRKSSVDNHGNDAPIFRSRNDSGPRSGVCTPLAEQDYYEDYHPEPTRYHASVLGAILDLRDRWSAHRHSHHEERDKHRHERPIGPHLGGTPVTLARYTSKGDLLATSPEPTPILGPTPTDSGTSTPRGWRSPWYFGSRQHSSASLHQLGDTDNIAPGFGEEVDQRLRRHKSQQKRPSLGERVRSSAVVERVSRQLHRTTKKEEYRIQRHISEVLQRQKYLLKLCKSLMTFGAPTHRLEEYLNMSARALYVDAHFLYLPSAMIVSFQDPMTHTTEVRLVKEPTGLHLSKMRDVHEIYKEVVHDRISAHEGLQRLHAVTSRPVQPWETRWFRWPFYGLASASVAPFAFNGQWTDLGPCCLLGLFVGWLHLWVAPSNHLYNDVFEIVAAIVTSCVARLVGSIRGGSVFCFAAMAQSSLALILPGYMVLMASLELQSKNFVAGSVRMVHAIIYSLTLGFGITIGTAVSGAILRTSTSDMTCSKPISSNFNCLFVLIFTISLMVINQASLKQAPSMIFVSLVGYVANYYASKRLHPSAQIASTLGALVIGLLANGYSRFSPRVTNWWNGTCREKLIAFWSKRRRQTPRGLEEGKMAEKNGEQRPPRRRQQRPGRSLAAAVMLPAILVQVPSGISIGGSLVSGLETANMLTSGITGTDSGDQSGVGASFNSTAFTVGFSVVQVALGITTGLFVAAIVWYPMGKRRSALFSF